MKKKNLKKSVSTWYKDHEGEIVRIGYYAFGFGAAYVSMKLAKKIFLESEVHMEVVKNKDDSIGMRFAKNDLFGKRHVDYAVHWAAESADSARLAGETLIKFAETSFQELRNSGNYIEES